MAGVRMEKLWEGGRIGIAVTNETQCDETGDGFQFS